MKHLVVAGTELGNDDPFILYWYRPLWLHSQVYNIPKSLSGILLSINTPQPILMTYRFIPSCHRLSSSQVHQMVSSPFQIQQKQTRTKRCCTSVRGALASPRQIGTAQVPTHRHMGYRPLSTWKNSVSGRTRFAILSEINSPSDSPKLDQLLSSDIRSSSVHTQSRTWVTDYLTACLPRQEGLRLCVGSNEYALLPISLTFFQGRCSIHHPTWFIES